MIYILSLVLFFSDGTKKSVELRSTYSADLCVEIRDSVRASLSSTNNSLEAGKKILDNKSGVGLEFIDAECNSQKIVY